ncbi:MAG: hypothetical protein EB117_18020 [Betaproteobacteria bacterium]|nr:hypothetical protein [Betaproteobacteria bacterium]
MTTTKTTAVIRVTCRRDCDVETYYEPRRLPADVLARLKETGWTVRQESIDAIEEIGRLRGRSSAAAGAAADTRGASSGISGGSAVRFIRWFSHNGDKHG